MSKLDNIKEVLLITWHGIHELEIFPGLPDTGGQNIYVQNMGEKIHDLYDARVTILNRGGFTHPYTERMREGYTKDPDRELYVLHVADEVPAFLRKEYLTGALIEQASENVVHQLPRDYRPDLIISNFWDGGLMALFLQRHFDNVPHLWVPHEPVGMKMAPLPDTYHERHSIPSRERYEKMIVEKVDAVGSTSQLVRDDLMRSYDGKIKGKIIDVYPGVDIERFNPFTEKHLDGAQVRRHAEYLNLPEELFNKPHICEFGRSDALKEKDKAVEAFARVANDFEDVVMFMNLDERMEPATAERIHKIIEDGGLEDRIHVLSPEQLPQSGNGSEIMPDLLKTSRLFITMSVMEGFGMAACEAAACGVPVIGTEAIPVVTDILVPADGGRVVCGGDVEAASEAISEILSMDEESYQALSDNAYNAVIPKYRWDTIVKDMIADLRKL